MELDDIGSGLPTIAPFFDRYVMTLQDMAPMATPPTAGAPFWDGGSGRRRAGDPLTEREFRSRPQPWPLMTERRHRTAADAMTERDAAFCLTC